MSKTKANQKKSQSDHHMADVLYQRLGQTWYAFAEVEGELYVSRVDREDLEASGATDEVYLAANETGNDLPPRKSPRAA